MCNQATTPDVYPTPPRTPQRFRKFYNGGSKDDSTFRVVFRVIEKPGPPEVKARSRWPLFGSPGARKIVTNYGKKQNAGEGLV
jgi:hypothetical protein